MTKPPAPPEDGGVCSSTGQRETLRASWWGPPLARWSLTPAPCKGRHSVPFQAVGAVGLGGIGLWASRPGHSPMLARPLFTAGASLSCCGTRGGATEQTLALAEAGTLGLSLLGSKLPPLFLPALGAGFPQSGTSVQGLRS